MNHGYGDDTVALCREHELLHVAFAHWLSTDSPTLALLSDGSSDPGDTAEYQRQRRLSGLEEAAILAIQKFTRAAGIDLIACMRRWSRSSWVD